MDADIGIIGVGVMGAALALNLAEKGFRVAVHDSDFDRMLAARHAAKDLKGEIEVTESAAALVEAVRKPRPFVILTPAGPAVDSVIAAYSPLLAEGDLLIDAGNSDFHDTRRRSAALETAGLAFLGLGLSGGAEGARHGPSIMAGGSPQLWKRVEAPLSAIAARHEGEPCCAWFGPDGAGHFVKTIHNGVEYAEMQMLAEAYALMRDGLAMAPAEIAAAFARWNAGPLASYLTEITATVLVAEAETGAPLIDLVQDRAGQKGTGGWSAGEALRLAAPAPMIEAAVGARNLSARKAERMRLERLFGPAPRPLGEALGGREEALSALGAALLAGRVAGFAQGFEVLRAASHQYGWAMDLAAIARVWRAGCIIRCALLDPMAAALEAAPEAALIASAPFDAIMRESEGPLRRIVAAAAAHGLPAPALAGALFWFDQLRTGRGAANLIQLQRDYFGRHGFERVDREGTGLHGPWA